MSGSEKWMKLTYAEHIIVKFQNSGKRSYRFPEGKNKSLKKEQESE